MVATYAGFTGDSANQPISAGLASGELFSVVDATFSADQLETRVDEQGEFMVSASISTSSPADLSAVVATVNVEHTASNSTCLLYTSQSPRDATLSRKPSYS